MTRPRSIVQFELLYLAAFLLGVISTVQTWGLQSAMLAQNPDAGDLSWLPYAALAVRAVVAAVLWYFVARVGSVVAKWFVVAFAVWAVAVMAMLLYGLATGVTAPANAVAPALQNIIYILATATLFRPDARIWFGEAGAKA